ncbi:hypothetical protein [Paludisphaera sp.]|uniref:hypothetical protein n=1 Tax=Paludisphaera sp. TaxID=2017432 RepID=UPI00301DA5AF
MRLINLKAAWEIVDADAPSAPVRVTLPLDWPALPWPDGHAPARALLVRRFGRPPIGASAPTLRLRLGGFAGVMATELNGSPIPRREDGDVLVVGPVELLERNTLTVAVDVALASVAPGPWGVEASLECG